MRDIERSPSGQPIYRHERTSDFTPVVGGGEDVDKIVEHFEKYAGAVDHVFHELISDLVHIDVHIINPTSERNYYTLFTTGMSDKPMTVPEGAEEWCYAELMICLPPDWKLAQEDLKNNNYYWPIEWLKKLARLPHEYNTWLGFGHTIPNGDPAVPFALNTKLCCALIVPAILLFDEELQTINIDENKTINVYALMPIYKEEMELKMRKGIDALIDPFAANNVCELLDINRSCVVPKKKFWGLF